MDVSNTISDLQELDGPKRKVDGDIARIIGWKKIVESRPSPSGEEIEVGAWYLPSGKKARKVPFYTESVNSAYELMKLFAPERAAACAFGPDICKAQIEGMDPVFSKSLPVAMCLAALIFASSTGYFPVDRSSP